jgi:hypothetical protein
LVISVLRGVFAVTDFDLQGLSMPRNSRAADGLISLSPIASCVTTSLDRLRDHESNVEVADENDGRWVFSNWTLGWAIGNWLPLETN